MLDAEEAEAADAAVEPVKVAPTPEADDERRQKLLQQAEELRKKQEDSR